MMTLTNMKQLIPESLQRLIKARVYFRPYFPSKVDPKALFPWLVQQFGLDEAELEARLAGFRRFYAEKDYRAQLGELKTLSFEETFILYLAMERWRPRTIVEIGTQYGKSARKLIDMKALLGLAAPVLCYDIADQVRYFEKEAEASLILQDLTGSFEAEVLGREAPGLIYLDAHPYALLKNVISGVLRAKSPWVLAIHDCGRGLFNPRMKISKDDPNISSKTGHWERYVLAELLGVGDPRSKDLDYVETETHRLCIFDTTHGLGVIVPAG